MPRYQCHDQYFLLYHVEVILEGEFRNGLLHSHGSICWPRGQIMDGVWDRGHIKYKRYTFSDGLSYCENKWDYCIFPDRRLI